MQQVAPTISNDELNTLFNRIRRLSELTDVHPHIWLHIVTHLVTADENQQISEISAWVKQGIALARNAKPPIATPPVEK